jgi:hypothetical protein
MKISTFAFEWDLTALRSQMRASGFAAETDVEAQVRENGNAVPAGADFGQRFAAVYLRLKHLREAYQKDAAVMRDISAGAVFAPAIGAILAVPVAVLALAGVAAVLPVLAPACVMLGMAGVVYPVARMGLLGMVSNGLEKENRRLFQTAEQTLAAALDMLYLQSAAEPEDMKKHVSRLYNEAAALSRAIACAERGDDCIAAAAPCARIQKPA